MSRIMLGAGIGTFIEIYDIVIYGYLAAVLAGQFFPSDDPVAALLATFAVFALGALLRPAGSVVFGHVGDRYGRRTAVALSLLLMTAATVGFGLAPTYGTAGALAPAILVLCRVLQALSAGGEVPGALLLMLEHAPAHHRGLIASLNNLAAVLATATAATVSFVLARQLPAGDFSAWGWRVAFLAAAPIGLVGLYVRLRLVDGPDFAALGERARQGRAPVRRAFATAKRSMAVLLVWFAAQTIGGYTLSVLMPTYLVRGLRMSPADAYAANLIAVLVSGVLVLAGGLLVDRFPLRPAAIVVLAGLAVTAVPGLLIVVHHRTLGAAVLGQVVCGAFLGGVPAIVGVAALRLVPVGIRFTAFGLPASVGTAVFGSSTPYVSTWLTAATGSLLAPGFYLFAAASVAAAVTVAALPRD